MLPFYWWCFQPLCSVLACRGRVPHAGPNESNLKGMPLFPQQYVPGVMEKDSSDLGEAWGAGDHASCLEVGLVLFFRRGLGLTLGFHQCFWFGCFLYTPNPAWVKDQREFCRCNSQQAETGISPALYSLKGSCCQHGGKWVKLLASKVLARLGLIGLWGPFAPGKSGSLWKGGRNWVLLCSLEQRKGCLVRSWNQMCSL